MIQNYDQIQGFEYWNIDAWKSFVSEHILPLHKSTSMLLKLREFISTQIGTNPRVTLGDMEKKRNDILPFLLGGINQDGEYKDNSFARLVSLTLGIYINPKEWVTLEKEEGLNAFDYVNVKNEATSFLDFLKSLNEITLQITKLVGTESKDTSGNVAEEVIQKPEGLLEIIKAIYVKCLQASANHNYYTFFTLSTRTVTLKSMSEAYPRLKGDFESLRNFLGLEKTFEPRINDDVEKKAYSVFSHLKGGFSDSLYKLNQEIWEYFAKENKYFENERDKSIFKFISSTARDLKQEYIYMIQQKLEATQWKFPDYMKTSDNSYYSGNIKGVYCHTYTISGPMLIKERSWGYSYSGNFNSSESDCSISFPKFLDDLAPALFLGSTFELKLSDNTLEILR